MAWAALFERAAAYGIGEDEVGTALADRRASGADGEPGDDP